ncbi:hypothetical protein [Subtercola sp. YIM 133946]|uniref:hypothetical protein n=1 Tax=Subtercola sp. YIM 133946 TaxID=3118909 RepID=UPI002F91C616
MRESVQNPAPQAGSRQEPTNEKSSGAEQQRTLQVSKIRPWAMTVAFWIAIALAAATIVNLAVLLLTFNWSAFADPSNPRTFVSYGRTMTLPSDISIGVTIAGNVLALVIVVVLARLAFRLRQGNNRARIILTIVGGLPVIGFVSTSRFDVFSVEILAAAVVLVLVWLPPSNAFIRRVKKSCLVPRSTQLAP